MMTAWPVLLEAKPYRVAVGLFSLQKPSIDKCHSISIGPGWLRFGCYQLKKRLLWVYAPNVNLTLNPGSQLLGELADDGHKHNAAGIQRSQIKMQQSQEANSWSVQGLIKGQKLHKHLKCATFSTKV